MRSVLPPMAAVPGKFNEATLGRRRFIELLESVRRGDVPPSASAIAARLSALPLVTNIEASIADHGYHRNLQNVFANLSTFDTGGWCARQHGLIYGSVAPGAVGRSMTTKFLSTMPTGGEFAFVETGLIASTKGWAGGEGAEKVENACVGYMLDDRSHYFMADYPSRMIRDLNGLGELTLPERRRALNLRDRIVELAITKYNHQPRRKLSLGRRGRRKVLVCDQAGGDASILFGRATPESFTRMLSAAIAEHPEAEIYVKIHPDSIANSTRYKPHFAAEDLAHPNVTVLREEANPIDLLRAVDQVYVCSSQIGFEALLAGRQVTVFGAPFYAGWGLTDDRLTIPHRSRRRSLADLVYAALIRWAIYALPGSDGRVEVEDAVEYLREQRDKGTVWKAKPRREDAHLGSGPASADKLSTMLRWMSAKGERVVTDDVSPGATRLFRAGAGWEVAMSDLADIAPGVTVSFDEPAYSPPIVYRVRREETGTSAAPAPLHFECGSFSTAPRWSQIDFTLDIEFFRRNMPGPLHVFFVGSASEAVTLFTGVYRDDASGDRRILYEKPLIFGVHPRVFKFSVYLSDAVLGTAVNLQYFLGLPTGAGQRLSFGPLFMVR
ncbi:capsular polysaccharide export protein, LipB/KpsS family [Halovulum sp. GXIMD14794]